MKNTWNESNRKIFNIKKFNLIWKSTFGKDGQFKIDNSIVL